MIAPIMGVLVCLFGGGYSIWVALQGWERSKENWRAQIVIGVLGNVGSRIFYFVLGSFLIALGVATAIFGFNRA